jgi:hypothetical protein
MCTSEFANKKNRSITKQLFNYILSSHAKNGRKIVSAKALSNYLLTKKRTTPALPITKTTRRSPYSDIHDLISKFTPRVEIRRLGDKAKPFEVPLPPSKKNLLVHQFVVGLSNQPSHPSPSSKQITQRLLSIEDDLRRLKGKTFQDSRDTYRMLKQYRPRAKKYYIAESKKLKSVDKNAITKGFYYYI